MDNAIIIEVKSVNSIEPVHHVQLKTYMKMAGIHYGILVNFNTLNLFQDGLFTWRL